MVNGQLGQLGCPSTPARTVEELTDGELLARFASQQDEAAFAALVQRHGPMVLAVCRRVLNDAHDADDAFQATFLVLLRKAGSIAEPELLGNWLYGVAYRVAAKAKVNAARRCKFERRATTMPVADLMLEVTGRELRSVLDAEMSRLPQKYRAPLVLCYLEGKTNEEAARQLGWPTGSMSGRLARGRELLRKRLVRRGLALSAGIFAMLLSKNAASAAVSECLLKSTVRGAVSFAHVTPAGTTAVSPSVSGLTEDMLKSMRTVNWKRKAALLLALALLIFLGSSTGVVAYGKFYAQAGQGCHGP